MIRSALFSPDEKYRYTLIRQDLGWYPIKKTGYVNFIMLNPSTANHKIDDPTIRRCMGYAGGWGYDCLVITNIFAYRTTYPDILKKEPEPEGPYNTMWLYTVALSADLVVCGWGSAGTHRNRGEYIAVYLDGLGVKLHHLGLTKAGLPKHPLYLKKDLEPILWDLNKTFTAQ